LNAPIESVLTGIVSNALWSLGLSLLRKEGGRKIVDKRRLQELLLTDRRLSDLLMAASAAVARTAKHEGNSLSETIRTFLVSPEVDTLLRRLYASQITKGAGQHIQEARDAFEMSLSIQLGRPAVELGDLVESLFIALQTGCETALNVAIDEGLLSAHEAKSTARHRLILDELSAIHEELRLFKGPKSPVVVDVLAFEMKYRELVGQRHGFITPPHSMQHGGYR